MQNAKCRMQNNTESESLITDYQLLCFLLWCRLSTVDTGNDECGMMNDEYRGAVSAPSENPPCVPPLRKGERRTAD
jgi:hypothetical protein